MIANQLFNHPYDFMMGKKIISRIKAMVLIDKMYDFN